MSPKRLSESARARALEARDAKEMLDILADEGVELPDELLDTVSGGLGLAFHPGGGRDPLSLANGTSLAAELAENLADKRPFALIEDFFSAENFDSAKFLEGLAKLRIVYV